MIYPCKTWECRDEPIFVFHFDAALGWIKPLNALNGRWMFMCGPASSCCTYALGEKFRGLVLQKLMLPMLGLYLILGNGPKKGSHQTCWKQPMPWQSVRVFQWYTLLTLITFLELCSNNLFADFTCFDMELALAPDTGAPHRTLQNKRNIPFSKPWTVWFGNDSSKSHGCRSRLITQTWCCAYYIITRSFLWFYCGSTLSIQHKLWPHAWCLPDIARHMLVLSIRSSHHATFIAKTLLNGSCDCQWQTCYILANSQH